MRSFSIKNSLILLIASASLIPISVASGQSGLFINYFYLLLLFLPFIKYRYSKTGVFLVLVYTFIYIVGIPRLFMNDLYYAARVTSSYIVFMIPFTLIFIKIEDTYFEKFKQAVIYVSMAYSLMLFFELISIGYSGDFYATKDLIGSNRFGFIIVFAFFVLFHETGYKLVYKILFLTILLVGLVLTFSRSSIVAFGVAALIWGALNFRKINVKYLLGAFLLGIVFVFVFRETIIGQIIDFFSQYLLSYGNYNLTNSRTSEGYRVYVFNQIIQYVVVHPLFGSNYAGLYLLYDEYRTVGASAHNQYTDVLLRTGLVGLTTILFIIYRMTKYYFYSSPGVFYGLMGILTYGLFHETFKLAHGSFIFAILLSYYLSKKEPKYKLIFPSAFSGDQESKTVNG